ncbi:hypothetical protein THAOC_26866 [Thalassiosira oceanica]|uniref:VWFA domain-containing protein n=1 Tax=Thalassiosira oceanica TaxID=159749 RepID=K0RXU6_THAOC|nr:hypothetical protein THAOC_26866 [Thalassiosira oceanica]|eukprot:EJK53651.1 hypothetical protein THAOC_26866 [Thalassiosira oceanica]
MPIVGDYSCHGHKSCISVTEYAVIGAGSCIGRESCRNLNGRIGAQSCLTPEMKDDLAYNFETDTPQSVCEDNSGQISASSCWWSRSCQSNQGRICEESCRGYEACQNNSGSVGAGSCTGEGSCNNNSGNIGAGACTIAGGCAHNTEDIPDGCPSLAAKQAGQCDGTVTLACNDPTLPSTPLMPTSSPSCSKTKDVNFDICFALDMSGSVCSKYDPTTCDNSCTPFDQCRDFTVDVGTCCENFRSIQDFTIDMVTALDRFNGEKSYSIVQFASSGSLVQSSSGDKLSTIDSVNGLVYTGGFTNHDQAILRCREALSGTPADRNKYMLVITDGVSTRPSQNPVDSAIASANLAKGDGINIIPVFITTTSSGQEALDFMSTISSNGMVFSVTNFESLETLEQELVEEVSC